MKLCECGCGEAVRPGCRFVLRHNIRMTRPNRSLGGRKGRATFAYRKRRELFARDIDTVTGRSLSREELFELLKRVYTRGYNSGYQCGLAKGQPALEETA